MEELLKQLLPSLLNIAQILLVALASYLGFKLKIFLADQQKRSIVESTVKYVEQVGKALGSDEKLALAKARALELLNAANLPISELELDTLIESFVLAFTEHYKIVEPVPPVEVVE